MNSTEVEVATEIVDVLISTGTVQPEELGVITPYRGQRSLIADDLTEHGEVEVSTVDEFQGRERDVIVFSAVSTKRGGLEFAGNPNRFNVAATRPKEQFIMIGNRAKIEKNAPTGNLLRKYIEYASENGAIFDWECADWADGIASDQITITPLQKESKTDSTGTSATGLSAANSQPWTNTELDETTYSRVADIVRLAPTSNGELAEKWDMIDGREAWTYLTMELPGYFEVIQTRTFSRRQQPEAS